MKKTLILTILGILVCFGIAYAAGTDTTTTTNYIDNFYKIAMAGLMTVLATILGQIVPIIARKGDAFTDTFWEMLKNYAKKIENERIEKRLESFIGILNKGTDELWEIAGKAKIEKTPEGKIIVTNMKELTDEVQNKVKPGITNSTRDLAEGLGVDAEQYIKERIQAKAEVLLR